MLSPSDGHGGTVLAIQPPSRTLGILRTQVVEVSHRVVRSAAERYPNPTLSEALLVLALVGAGAAIFDRGAARAQIVDRLNEARSGLPNAGERVPIWPDQWPWSSIGRINIAITTQRSICTGSLVGPRVVITAAHCVFDERMNQWIKPSGVHFVAGLSPGLKYSGHSAVSSYVASPKFKTGLEDQRPDDRYSAQRKPLSAIVALAKTDWAVLILENALNLQPIPIQPTREAELPGSDTENEIVLPGYGADRRELLAISRGCAVKTDVQEMGQGSLAHTCDIAAGGSGSPILLLKHRNAVVIGIATAARIGLPYVSAHGGIGVSATEFEQAVSAAPR